MSIQEQLSGSSRPRERAEIRIATVYRRDFYEEFQPVHMNLVRWLRMSEVLARLGYRVDMIVDTGAGVVERSRNLRLVPYSRVRWSDYDVVKTLFHKGFDSLRARGGDDHPFIVSKLGSVVGSDDSVSGVHFFGEERERLHETQQRVRERSRYVTVLTPESQALWVSEFGWAGNLLLVPTGVDRDVPPPRRNPYVRFPERIAVYIGTIYDEAQRETNLFWQERLNALGRELKRKNVRLCFVGPGRTDRLDRGVVTILGPVANTEVWDYQYFADVGLVLAQGPAQHNESSKIYYYLRTGLPVVSEQPVPNNHVIAEARLGLVCNFCDERGMAHAVEAAIQQSWDKAAAISYVLENHTWERRATIYDDLFCREWGLDGRL